jgi:hypothetical protein
MLIYPCSLSGRREVDHAESSPDKSYYFDSIVRTICRQTGTSREEIPEIHEEV